MGHSRYTCILKFMIVSLASVWISHQLIEANLMLPTCALSLPSKQQIVKKRLNICQTRYHEGISAICLMVIYLSFIDFLIRRHSQNREVGGMTCQRYITIVAD